MDRVKIINRALSRIGCLPVQSDAAPGPAGVGVVHTYESLLDDMLSKYPWHFTKRFAALVRSAEAPVVGWKNRFVLPPDRLALPRAYHDSATSTRPLMRFQVETGHVLADASTLFAEYQARPHPSTWPGYFGELMVLALAAEFALEIREDPALRKELRRDAYGDAQYQGEGGQFKIASDLDAQANPSQQPAGGANPLTDVRDEYDPDDARCGW